MDAVGGSEDEVPTGLEEGSTPADRPAWTRGTVVHWANEAFGDAKAKIYRGIEGRGGNYAPIILSPDCADSQHASVAMQLERAGARLAAFLNWYLK